LVKLIFLTGMPGSGKSTTGKLLATKLGYAFIDLDHEIEKTKSKSIRHIFADEGEDAFRLFEHESLVKLIEEIKNNTVISLGGGTVAFHNNLELVKKAGKLIYLEVKQPILTERLKNQTSNRPLFQATDPELKINLLLALRERYYRQAHILVDANGKAEDVAEKITELIG